MTIINEFFCKIIKIYLPRTDSLSTLTIIIIRDRNL